MLPVITIVGRPNVGKSTLFNRLTKTRDALVADMPGVTRDRIFGRGAMGDKPYILVDTGGIGPLEHGVDNLMQDQSKQAILEADFILFMVDGKSGMTAQDEDVAQFIRKAKKPLQLVVNKTDGSDPNIAIADFFSLGLGEPYPIAASQGRGVTSLIEGVLEKIPEFESPIEEEDKKGIQLAIVGRPNVGKSTLVNRILGEERVVVCDLPGTTRDSVFIPMTRHGKEYTLIDTAGVRRRAKVSEHIEKFSIIKTLQAIEAANVVVMVLDAREGVSEQDLRLLSFILTSGRALVLAINKWDGLDSDTKERCKEEIHRRMPFIDFARSRYISALHGTGVGDLFKYIHEAYDSAFKSLSTPKLTECLEKATQAHPPPLFRGRRIKLRYAHQGGQNPPLIIIHGNQTKELSQQYHRYLINHFRKAFNLIGTPIQLFFKTGDNPYKDKRNVLTLSQERKRKRMMKHVKKSKK